MLNKGYKFSNLKKTRFTCLHRIEKNQQEDWKSLNTVMDGMIIPTKDHYFQYGFEVLGPLLFGFSNWLHGQMTGQKFEHLFFFSRDGYLLLKAYNELYPDNETPVDYLYISRKAAREAQLWINSGLHAVSGLFPENIYLGCREFCGYFNIADDETFRIWEKCGLKKDMKFFPGDLLQDSRLRDFYERVKPRIVEESKKSYEKMVKYLAQKNFHGKVGIVDIGWRGTIQDCLNVIFRNNAPAGCEVVGCYLGLSREASCAGDKISFISPDEEPQEFDAGFVEYPFLAPEGSLLGYSYAEDNTIKPVLADYEYDRESHLIAKSMQEGTLYFIKCAKDFPDGYFKWDPAFSYANLKRISKHPRLWEAELFGDLAYYDGGKRQIAAPRSFAYYLLHMKDFPYDLSVSGWRIAFLKRLFKAGFDYNRILKLYKNLKNKKEIK